MNEKEMLKALGPLAPLMETETITEIMVDAPDRVYVERRGAGGALEDAGVTFASPQAIRGVIDAVLALESITLGPGRTTAEVRLPDGSRFLAMVPPTAISGPAITLRKFFKGSMTWEQLYEYRSATPEVHALLQRAIAARVNILIAGGTGSGKTTVLNMLTGDIPDGERVVVVEEIPEYQPRASRLLRLACENSGLSYAELIQVAAHTRPDRLVFGELHGGETMHVLDLINKGYDGALMNIHATGPEDALSRMETMCLMANLGLGLSEIRRLIASCVGLISYQERLPNGKRKITQIVEVCGLEDDRYVLQTLMRYNPETDQFEMSGPRPGWEKG